MKFWEKCPKKCKQIFVFRCFSQNIHLRFYTNKYISHDALIEYKDILVQIILGRQFMLEKTILMIFSWNLKAATAYLFGIFPKCAVAASKIALNINVFNHSNKFHKAILFLIEMISNFGIKFHFKIIFVCSLDVNILRLGIINHITNYAMDHYQRKLPSFVEKKSGHIDYSELFLDEKPCINAQ